MITLKKHLSSNQSFTRLRSLEDVQNDLTEARRVGYIVKTENDTDDYGNDLGYFYSFTIWDDETGDIVMTGLGPVNGTHYATRFSTLYWQEPRL